MLPIAADGRLRGAELKPLLNDRVGGGESCGGDTGTGWADGLRLAATELTVENGFDAVSGVVAPDAASGLENGFDAVCICGGAAASVVGATGFAVKFGGSALSVAPGLRAVSVRLGGSAFRVEPGGTDP
jgi:hypothetical protein